VQKEVALFTDHTMDSYRETLAKCRKLARLCALFKAYEQAWKAISDRLGRAYSLSRVGHVRKIRDRKERTDIGNYSL